MSTRRPTSRKQREKPTLKKLAEPYAPDSPSRSLPPSLPPAPSIRASARTLPHLIPRGLPGLHRDNAGANREQPPLTIVICVVGRLHQRRSSARLGDAHMHHIRHLAHDVCLPTSNGRRRQPKAGERDALCQLHSNNDPKVHTQPRLSRELQPYERTHCSLMAASSAHPTL